MMMRALRIAVLVLAVCMASFAVTAPGRANEAAAPTAAGRDAGARGDHEGEAELNPLTFEKMQRDLAIWTAIVFLLLLAVLWRFAWKPIIRALDRREQLIAGHMAAAERSNAEAKKLLEHYQQKLNESDEEVRELLADAKREAVKSGEAIVKQAHSAAVSEKNRALREIEAATNLAVEELAQRSATLVVGLARKVIGEEINPEIGTRLIHQAVDDVAKKKTK